MMTNGQSAVFASSVHAPRGDYQELEVTTAIHKNRLSWRMLRS